MMKHTPWLVDGNKWRGNKVDTRDVHCTLKPLRGSQQTTQIVMSEQSGMNDSHTNAL